MARKSESKAFDDLEVTVQQLPATRAMRLSRRLAKVAAPAISALQGLAKGSVLDADVGVIGKALAEALEQFSEADLDSLIKELLETATVKIAGKTAPLLPVLDDVLAGRTFTLYKILAFALAVNFADFFEALRGMQAKKTLEEPAP